MHLKVFPFWISSSFDAPLQACPAAASTANHVTVSEICLLACGESRLGTAETGSVAAAKADCVFFKLLELLLLSLLWLLLQLLMHLLLHLQ